MTGFMPGHPCPICGVSNVAAYRFACTRCHHRMPDDMKRQAAHAWKFRLSEPKAYFETLAWILLWDRERKANETEQWGEPGE